MSFILKWFLSKKKKTYCWHFVYVYVCVSVYVKVNDLLKQKMNLNEIQYFSLDIIII